MTQRSQQEKKHVRPDKSQDRKTGKRGHQHDEGTREVRPGGHEPGTRRGPKPKRPAAAKTKGGSS